jgi:RimJ/RimL family protein N-acetyltransferase
MSDATRAPLAIVGGAKEAVGLFLLERVPEVTSLPGGYEAIGVARYGRLVGGCLFTDFTPCRDGATIQIWAAGHDWISRRVVREMLGYPFRQLGCHRITALTGRHNRESRRLLQKLGFKFEGVARAGYGPGRDAFLYGLLRDEQRWV